MKASVLHKTCIKFAAFLLFIFVSLISRSSKGPKWVEEKFFLFYSMQSSQAYRREESSMVVSMCWGEGEMGTCCWIEYRVWIRQNEKGSVKNVHRVNNTVHLKICWKDRLHIMRFFFTTTEKNKTVRARAASGYPLSLSHSFCLGIDWDRWWVPDQNGDCYYSITRKEAGRILQNMA